MMFATETSTLAPTVPTVRRLPPVLGLLGKLWRDPARGLYELYHEYGPVFEAPIPGRKVWIAMGPDALRTIFKQRTDICSAAIGNGQFSWLMGQPIETLDGEEHRRVRNIMQAATLGESLSRVGPVMGRVVDEVVADWETIPLWEAMRLLTLHIILHAGLGADRAMAPKLERWFDDFTRAFFAPKIPLPLTRHTRGLRARTKIDEWLEGHLAKTRREHGQRADVMAILLEGEHGLQASELFDNLRILVFASQETTASILAWALIELARDRELWREVVAEVPSDAPLPVTLAEARQYRLLGALLNESLRRYTPAWFVPRGVRGDDLRLEGYEVPRGTMLGASPLGTHHIDELWPDPFRFDVGRWLSDRPIPANSFMPFGGGPHTCLGAAFATLEMTQVLVAIARRRKRPVLDRDFDLRPVLLGLPHPSRHIRVRFATDN